MSAVYVLCKTRLPDNPFLVDSEQLPCELIPRSGSFGFGFGLGYTATGNDDFGLSVVFVVSTEFLAGKSGETTVFPISSQYFIVIIQGLMKV